MPIFASGAPLPALPTGAWDLISFLNSAKSYVQVGGGAFLMLIGTAGLVWGAFLAIKKLWSNPQSAGQQSGWGTIVAIIIVGGAMAGGGWSLVSKVGSGGQKTVTEMGGGSILLHLHSVADAATWLPF